jgi:hypothetical protein
MGFINSFQISSKSMARFDSKKVVVSTSTFSHWRAFARVLSRNLFPPFYLVTNNDKTMAFLFFVTEVGLKKSWNLCSHIDCIISFTFEFKFGTLKATIVEFDGLKRGSKPLWWHCCVVKWKSFPCGWDDFWMFKE